MNKIKDMAMSEQNSWGLIGSGNIGQELQRQLSQPEVAERIGLSPLPEFAMRSSGVFADIADLPDVVFVATPSTEHGEPSYGYISRVLQDGKIAVTAEKGALANYFSELRDESDNFSRLGINATVGGGTRLVSGLQEFCKDKANVRQLHLALNGTLTAIFGSIAPPEGLGMSFGQAVHQAVELGYAEPGHQDPYDVVRSEAEGDIPKKTAILFNRLGLSEEVLGWEKLKFEVSDDDISQTLEEARVRRFIVSIYPIDQIDKTGPENDMISGFDIQHDSWVVAGGFRHIEKNPLFHPLANLTGPGNGFVVGLGPHETDGVYSLSGPGAGVRPTVNTMIDDYLAKKQLLA